MKDKQIFVDTETSGLDIPPAVLLAIGAVTSDGHEFSILIEPTEEEWSKASPKALEVNGLTLEVLQEKGAPCDVAVDLFVDWLYSNNISRKEYSAIFQNPSFDLGFFRHTKGMIDSLEFVGFPLYDTHNVMDLYMKCIHRGLVKNYAKWPNGKPKRDGKSISLGLGVEPEPDVHDALEGARVVQRNFAKCMELLADRI